MLEKVFIVAVVAALAAAQIVFPQGGGSAAAAGAAAVAANGNVGVSARASAGAGGSSPQIFFPRESERPDIPCTTYEGKQGSCRLLFKCATFYAEIAQLSRSPCTINSEQQGVCCPQTQEPVTDVGGLISKLPPAAADVSLPNIQFPEVNHACEMGIKEVDQKEAFEDILIQNNVEAKEGSSMAQHAKLFQTTPEIVQKGKDASKNIAASVILVNQFKLDKEQGGFGLPRFGIQNTVIQDTCPPEPLCPDTKYRAINATCNNRRNKSWGMAATAFQRILPADYDDGVNTPRSKSKTGNPLPSARAVSAGVIVDRDNLYDNFTLLIMQWGQFLDHDMTHTPITKRKDMADITCCRDGAFLPEQDLHPECLPIDIPANDPFYSRHNQRCMGLVRSLPAPRPACNLGPREQMNQITAFIDGSNVYGSTVEESKELRTFTGGLLKENNAQQHFLPENKGECMDQSGQMYCFKAGDTRVNEQPQLTVMHTLWMRQHNRLARELAKLNPGWNDEILFQEARRIVAAQMQHITYHEYLPIILGRQFMQAFGLVPRKSGYAPGYREDIDPSINNVFATAAFRYGHTLVTGFMKAFSKFGTVDQDLKLSENQFKPFSLFQPGGFDGLVRGLSSQPSQKFDRFFSDQLTNHLFPGQTPTGVKPFGMDLVALNLQRGRDHGLPPYNQWRHICGLRRATSFQDLSDHMDPDVIRQLQQIYEHVDDIDIFIGGIAENPIGGSLLGHTFLCIVGDQFARLRLGDRFYYENGGLESSFREEQLEEIRQTSLARIMCDNSDGVEMMQPLVFIQAHLVNKRASCASGSHIPRVSLEPWRNEPVWA